MAGWVGSQSYEGAIRVELYASGIIEGLPSGAVVDSHRREVYIPSGRIKQVMGGIQFHINGEPWAWRYDSIKRILDKDRNPLWVNSLEDH